MVDGAVAKLIIESGGSKDEKNDGNDDSFLKRLSKQGAGAYKQGQKMLRTNLGINASMGAILKQSQIFTGLFGTLFQILGALADVLLMPLVPFLLPFIKLIAKAIPIVKATAQGTFDFVGKIWGGVKDFFSKWFGWIPGGGTLSSLLEGIGKVLVGIGTVIMLAKLTGLWSIVKFFLKTSLGKKMISGVIKPILGTLMSLVGKLIPGFIKGLPAIIIKGTKNLFKSGISSVKELGKLILSKFGFISRMFGAAGGLASSLWNGIKAMLAWVVKPFAGFLNVFKSGWSKIVTGLARLPVIGGAFKGLSGLFSKGAGGALSKMAGGARFIPGVGMIATAGFGAYDTYKAFQSGGLKSGLIEGAGALVKTGAAAGGLPTALLGNILTDMVVDRIQTNITIQEGSNVEAKIVNERKGSEQILSMYGQTETVQ